jgi:ABC-type multidrug transport system fused ATPase/permease subunit
MESIRKIRDTEIDIIRYIAKLWALVNFTFMSVPFLMTFATFFTFVFSSPDNQLTAEVIFVSLSLFNLIRTPLTLFPLALMDVIKLFVSINRISDFLNADELDSCYSSEATASKETTRDNMEHVLEIRQGAFTWDRRGGEGVESAALPSSTLSGINLSLRRGELVALVGVVGAGKSSLLAAILGEMAALEGQVELGPGGRRKAYVNQQAWIQNMTIRDNILFGSEYEEELYNKTLVACSLTRDLQEQSFLSSSALSAGTCR